MPPMLGFLDQLLKTKALGVCSLYNNTVFFEVLRNQDIFMKHAKAHDKIWEGGTMIAIMNDHCKIKMGNP
jgi:hypothetical protein